MVSELVERSGVPLATVKYYLREGLLAPGESTSATRARYSDEHLRRLALIKALSGVGLPIAKIKTILALIDDPGPTLFDSAGAAVSALPPYPDNRDCARAEAMLDAIGQPYHRHHPALGHLDYALAAADAAGVPMTVERLAAYAPHLNALARLEIDLLTRESPSLTIEHAVLGTIFYEPVIAALRRLAHAHFAATTLEDNA